ncbi:hypothetical protein SDC9_143955 [bioreactor metagenome]|uniref:Uncharacterized protein n=1 Tax=bioreactor metagenome TaxID=1076179 RepID=A0A645E4T6_9ZZZZ
MATGRAVPGLEPAVHRGASAARIGLVQDVVMDQDTGVQQFEGADHRPDRGRDVVIAGRADIAPVGERRTQPLAARRERPGQVDQVGGLGAEFGQRVRPFVQEAGQLGAHRPAQVCRQRVRSVQVDHGLSLDCRLRERCHSLARMPGPEPTIADALATGGRPTMSFEFFPPKDDAAQAQLAAAGYPTVADESFDSRELIERESMPDFCLAFIELNTRLGLERINTITSTVICLIAPSSGDLFGWELIAPTDAGPLDDLTGNPQA